MSQSEAFDAMQIAADALALDGEAAFDAACEIVEGLGVWDFECWPKPKSMQRRLGYGYGAANLLSFDAMLKHHYPPSSLSSRPTIGLLPKSKPEANGSFVVTAINRNRGTITFGHEPMEVTHSDPLAFETTPVAKRARVARQLWRTLKL